MRGILIFPAVVPLGFSGAALAQTNDRQCARLQQIVNSPPPTIGALASLKHTVVVLRSAIGIIDLPCGEPYIVSTDKAAITQERARLYEAGSKPGPVCLQLTSGVTTFADLPDSSLCKEDVSGD